MLSIQNYLEARYEVYNRILRRVVFQAPERKDCRQWLGSLINDPDLEMRKIKD